MRHRARDVLEEGEVGHGRQMNAMQAGLSDCNVLLVPEADVRHILRDQPLRLGIERPALVVRYGGRGTLDEPIHFGVLIENPVEAGRRRLLRVVDTPQHVRIGHAHPLQRVHLEVSPRCVRKQRQELTRSHVNRNTDTGQILLNGRRLDAVDLGRRGLQRQSEPWPRTIAIRIGKTRGIEQPPRLRRIVAKVEHVALERPGHRWDDPDRDCREPAPKVLDDGLAVDRKADRLADIQIAQHRIALVQTDVGVVGAGR
jgi:hypothetical protein